MSRAVKSNNTVESNVYAIRPEFQPVVHYLVLDPTGAVFLETTVNWHDVTSALLETEVQEILEENYRESLDGSRWNDDDFNFYENDNVEEVAKELGYRILTVIKEHK